MKRINNWTEQEDNLLLKLHQQVDCFQKWKFISENFKKKGFLKNQIQCRQRFVNKLNPELRQDKLKPQELKLLFQYYDQYGPLWSVFQSLIPGRNQNLLKNKFYSTLRSLVRILITSSQKSYLKKNNISSTSLSSKLLVEIYEGKKGFRKYKGVFRSFLEKMNFQIDLEKVKLIDGEIVMEILEKIKQDIQKTKNPKKKTNVTKSKKQNKKIKEQQKNEGQQQNIHSTIIITQQIKEKKSQIQQENNNSLKGSEISQPQYIGFYVPEINSLNYFLSMWNYGFFSQLNGQQYKN